MITRSICVCFADCYQNRPQVQVSGRGKHGEGEGWGEEVTRLKLARLDARLSTLSHHCTS